MGSSLSVQAFPDDSLFQDANYDEIGAQYSTKVRTLQAVIGLSVAGSVATIAMIVVMYSNIIACVSFLLITSLVCCGISLVVATYVLLELDELTWKIDRIFDNLGLSLKSIGRDLLEKVPSKIDFKNIGYFRGSYLEDLQKFRRAAHGNVALVADTEKENIVRRAEEDDSNVQFCHNYLGTNEGRSVYAKHGLKAEEMNGRNTLFFAEGSFENFGPNQFDFSRISEPNSGKAAFYVSSMPSYDQNDQNVFFQALKREGISVIVDLHEKVCVYQIVKEEEIQKVESKFDYTYMIRHDEKNIRYENREVAKELQSSVICGKFTYSSHTFLHIHKVDLRDNCALDVNDALMLMKEIFLLAKRNNFDPMCVVFHCAGGLGRAPTNQLAYCIWNACRMARNAGVSVVADWDKQEEKMVDGKMNLVAVLRNAYLEGLFSRSTFVQSKEQFEFLEKFVNTLTKTNVEDE
ncbi:MAG: hypothetical protein LBG86_00085 [Puniceicoccales bacterium]|jgi:hypothetical protein|nr:hypothetical protein [Puniceicoccales bacterium]